MTTNKKPADMTDAEMDETIAVLGIDVKAEAAKQAAAARPLIAKANLYEQVNFGLPGLKS